ncbi:uncharacterized protein BO96DRAFT_461225 [Aspergillus niger CBS 101883]|uniref:Uncharacterized protein n=3 Tax=Aspergillus niger TaxID=5061 RepID=A2QE83_ASPNC|nr:uncharacterized protein BO96DRAFT_461225 [Aspergillus niger CBS 101883]XP_059600067.1 hypothetical protein An02g09770 [Aspergillus niger]PYH61719.1 hypothetical protein BO96DRAFT_461225 [Aspergillus niger CBS 101883]RDH23028.1 hypothetical protein M747DRAFT_254931 [Aspergillus niger ATCC 13496]CAK37844.1 hypothetical protein An02g09770 [Aspergillus niger]
MAQWPTTCLGMTMRTSHDNRTQLFAHQFHVTVKVLWPVNRACAWYLPQIHSLSCILSECVLVNGLGLRGDLLPIASMLPSFRRSFEFTELGIPPRHETETVQHIVYPEGQTWEVTAKRMVGKIPSSFLDFGRSTEHDPGEPLHRQTGSHRPSSGFPPASSSWGAGPPVPHTHGDEIFKGSSTCRYTRESTGVERSFPVDRVKRPSKLRHCMAAGTGKVAGEKVPFRCLATEIVGRGKAENSGYGIRPVAGPSACCIVALPLYCNHREWIEWGSGRRGRPLDAGIARKKKGYPAARPVRLAREVPKEIRSLDRKCSRHRSTEG